MDCGNWCKSITSTIHNSILNSTHCLLQHYFTLDTTLDSFDCLTFSFRQRNFQPLAISDKKVFACNACSVIYKTTFSIITFRPSPWYCCYPPNGVWPSQTTSNMHANYSSAWLSSRTSRSIQTWWNGSLTNRGIRKLVVGVGGTSSQFISDCSLWRIITMRASRR